MQAFGEPPKVPVAGGAGAETTILAVQELLPVVSVKLFVPAVFGVPVPDKVTTCDPVDVNVPVLLNDIPFTVPVLIE